ncbi:AI-2E family transporter YdiK [Limobrevibacterium gyesilva]|uniref:AI-2E family transporter YdiK n=1 Tax=Limobrevibacterium gyesilva TaxID=2991712 RepID=A0AA41YL99_9PROT|nr:AI-2E family transporter YdiK [Limobrevibacterium gyesilva]MCW3474476.1 AI-2E family transporter YdiK [Limobrevibacterium gyesilva]
MADAYRDLTRTTLAVLFIGGMITTCFWILGPFLPAIVWAVTLVIATWQLMLRAQAALWNMRGLAVAVMTLGLLLVFIVPFWFAIGTIVGHAGQIAEWVRALASFKLPPAPDWLTALPLVGARATQLWDEAADRGLRDLAPQLAPYAGQVTNWFVGAVGSLGIVFVQFLLTVILAGIMYAKGEQGAAMARRFGHRLAGERGAEAVRLAGQAIRGVALAVVVTAAAQSLLGGIAIAVAGVPFASVLTALMFMLCIAQLGPGLVLLPAVIWMYVVGSAAWGTFLLVSSLVVISLDNFLRPILIRKGADLPLLLILGGVIGGLLSFGLVGIFLGPAALAVTYTLLQAWMAEDDAGQPTMDV